jgi:hypothetical protein
VTARPICRAPPVRRRHLAVEVVLPKSRRPGPDVVWRRRSASRALYGPAHVFIEGKPGCQAAARPAGTPTPYGPIREWLPEPVEVSPSGDPFGVVCTICQRRARGRARDWARSRDLYKDAT